MMAHSSFSSADFPLWRKLLYPLSWLYGAVTIVRNLCFDKGILPQKTYGTPTISVGNLAVGGSGKTPQVEYLIDYLSKDYRVATLSRGYGRTTKGFRYVEIEDTPEESGDEPLQMKKKYPNVIVSVCEDRCKGVEILQTQNHPQVILLDDAYQHRYLRPKLSLLLTDYRRPYFADALMPVGRLRENPKGASRANVIVVTKCPPDLTKDESEHLKVCFSLKKEQELFFTALRYGELYRLNPLKKTKNNDESFVNNKYSVILAITGIASNVSLLQHLHQFASKVEVMSFRDHHKFSSMDAQKINATFEALGTKNACIITTEKDAVRLRALKGLSPAVLSAVWVQPIRTYFLFEQEQAFNRIIENSVLHHSH